MPDWVATAIVGVLEENHRYGTGSLAAGYFYSPAAGKTGTTENHADAWYCGMAPTLSTTVWMGYPRAQISMYNIHGFSAIAGGTLPALIWGKFMQSAYPEGLDRAFPEAKTEPQWETFTRTYANRYYVSPGYSSDPGTTPATTETPTETQPPAPEPTPEPPPPPEPPPEPPPPTTTEPPQTEPPAAPG
jgi:membrane peptidoglycan carboxypeptidase